MKNASVRQRLFIQPLPFPLSSRSEADLSRLAVEGSAVRSTCNQSQMEAPPPPLSSRLPRRAVGPERRDLRSQLNLRGNIFRMEHVMKNASVVLGTTLHSTVTLSFVIPRGCDFFDFAQKGLLSTSPASRQSCCPLAAVLAFQKPSPFCHPERSRGTCGAPFGRPTFSVLPPLSPLSS